MLRDLQKAVGGRPLKTPPHEGKSFATKQEQIARAGLSQKQAEKFENLAKVPDEQFERAFSTNTRQTTTGIINASAPAIGRQTGATRHRPPYPARDAIRSPWPCLALIRANLTPAQEASAIARRKAIYEELHPETKHGAIGNGRVANLATLPSDRFTKETSAATGKSERNIQRAASRGEKLGDDLKEIEGTSLDKGVAFTG